MFSFFKSKKTSPNTPPEGDAPIPAADDYIFVDRKNDPQPAAIDNHPQRPQLYPLLNPTGNFHMTNVNLPPQSPPPMHLLSGIPFKLSPTICNNQNATEIDRLWIDEILSRITGVDSESYTYDFTLEKEIVEQ